MDAERSTPSGFQANGTYVGEDFTVMWVHTRREAKEIVTTLVHKGKSFAVDWDEVASCWRIRVEEVNETKTRWFGE